jgi:hypothetical protein
MFYIPLSAQNVYADFCPGYTRGMSIRRRLISIVGWLAVLGSAAALIASWWPDPPLVIRQALAPGAALPGVELQYPATLHPGETGWVRLALNSAPNGESPPATQSLGGPDSTPFAHANQNYNITAVAHFDSIGLRADRPGDWEQTVLPGQTVVWRWAVTGLGTGRQRVDLIVRERLVSQGGATTERVLWARTLPIVVSPPLLGMPVGLLRVSALAAFVIGLALALPQLDRFHLWLARKLFSVI